MFHGLMDKYLTQEEKDDIIAKYRALKADPNVSVVERNKIIIAANFLALDRLNKVSWPPSKSTLKTEWLSEHQSNIPNEELYRWHLVGSEDDNISVWSAIADDAANDYDATGVEIN